MKPCPFCGEVPKLASRQKPALGGGLYLYRSPSVISVECCDMMNMLQNNIVSEAEWDKRPMVHKIIVDVDGGYACEV